VWELAKAKMVCEGGDDIDGEMGDDVEVDENGIPQPKKKAHGGCGHRQPIFRKEGLGLSVNFKANANDVSVPSKTIVSVDPHLNPMLTIISFHAHRTLNQRAREL
jgi:hypothetical protein